MTNPEGGGDPKDDPGEMKSASALANDFEKFLKMFKAPDGSHKYFDAINLLMGKYPPVLVVDADDLGVFDPILHRLFFYHSDDAMAAMREATLSLLREMHPSFEEEVREDVEVRIICPSVDKQKIKQLDYKWDGRLVSLEGRVTSTTEVVQFMVKKSVVCDNCNTAIQVYEINSMPKKCPKCSEKHFKLDTSASLFVTQQFIKISQDTKQSSPAEIWVEVRAGLAGKFDLGDDVFVVGMGKLAELTKVKGPFDLKNGKQMMFYLRGINVEYSQGERNDNEISSEWARKRRQWCEENDKFDLDGAHMLTAKLVVAFAPYLYDLDMLKELLLLMACTDYEIRNNIRRWLNIAIIGSFGEGKTSLLLALESTFAALYESGEGVSEVGLGAALVDDRTLQRKVIGAGIGVAGNGRIKILDEADKMADIKYWAQLQTMMENGFYPLSKGGIIQKLPTLGPWIVALNPKFLELDTNKPLTEQVNIPKHTLSRIDVVVYIPKTIEKHKKQHKMDVMYEAYRDKIRETVATTDLAKHVMLARKSPPPAFAEGVKEMIDDYYHRLDSLDESKYGEIVVTLRQYRSLFIMAESRARMCLRPVITKEDGKRAMELMDYALTSIGVDIKFGSRGMGSLFNQDRKTVGKFHVFIDVFNGLAAKSETHEVSEDELGRTLEEQCQFTAEDFKKCMDRMKKEGAILEQQRGIWRKV